MARPKDEPIRSISLFTMRTERFTSISYNEIVNVRKAVATVPSVVRIEMLGILKHREVALRAVSAACRVVTRARRGSERSNFEFQVLSAVGEAFNNIVLHSYAGRKDGVIEMKIRTTRDRISIEMRDYGDGGSFDPKRVGQPDFESLPESGMGLFIIRSSMEMTYRPGPPNVLTLSKTLPQFAPARRRQAAPSDGKS